MDHNITRAYVPAFKPHAPGDVIPLSIAIDLEYRQHNAFGPEKVGVQRNGYGHDTSDLLLKPSPELWLEQGLTAELQRVGFNVTGVGSTADVELRLVVEQFFVEPGVGAFSVDVVGILATEAEVKIPRTGAQFARLFVGIDQSSRMLVLASTLEEALIAAAHRCFRELVLNLLGLLEQQGVLT